MTIPPGHQDKLFCPFGYRMRPKLNPDGWTGPLSQQFECIATNGSVLPVKTWGSKIHPKWMLTILALRGYHSRKNATLDMYAMLRVWVPLLLLLWFLYNQEFVSHYLRFVR